MNNGYSLTQKKYLLKSEQVELERLLEKYRSSDLRDTTMLLFMLKSGLRPGEVLKVLWSDINFDDGYIFIRTSKGGPERRFPLTEDLLSRFLGLGPGEGCERVFKIKYNRFLQIWQKYRPVEKRLHSLRHTFAVNLYKKSRNDVRLVQQALGHCGLQTTSIYLQFENSLDDFRNALDET